MKLFFFISPNASSSVSSSSSSIYLCLSVHLPFSHLFDGSFPSVSPRRVPYLSPQVDYRTEDGTANAGSDYEFAEGTLLFKPGETQKGESRIFSGNKDHLQTID